MTNKAFVFLFGLAAVSFTPNAFSQCNAVDAVTTASLKITGGEACSTYANLDWQFRRTNGTMTIEWGTTTSYGTSKSLYSANPVNIPNLTPNTEYFYHVFGNYQGRNHDYSRSSFTTAASAPPPNKPPVITSPAAFSCTTGTTTTYAVVASDPDNDQITLSVSGQPNWATFASPTLTFNPVAGSAPVTITIMASDGKDGKDTLLLSVSVVAGTSVMATGSARQVFYLNTGTTRIGFTPSGNRPVTVSLHTLSGATLLQRTFRAAAAAGAFTLPGGISPGIYLVRLTDSVHSRVVTLNIRK
jgi:large repetitive protein